MTMNKAAQELGTLSHRATLKKYTDLHGLIKGRKEYSKEMKRRSSMRKKLKDKKQNHE